MKLMNLAGIKFGMLTAIERVAGIKGHTVWRCVCDCGRTVDVRASCLKHEPNPTRSCGCVKFCDLTGKRFGKLVALERIGKGLGNRGWVWRCQCDCGNIVETFRSNLTSNFIHSCGCAIRDLDEMPFSSQNLSRKFSAYKNNARRREIEFTLTRDDFNTLCTSPCSYCGQSSGQQYVNGIDRIDSNSGYVASNVTSCCKICNYMKNTLGQRAFIEHCKKVVSHVG